MTVKPHHRRAKRAEHPQWGWPQIVDSFANDCIFIQPTPRRILSEALDFLYFAPIYGYNNMDCLVKTVPRARVRRPLLF